MKVVSCRVQVVYHRQSSKESSMEPTPGIPDQPTPQPQPRQPEPGPIEIDTGGLHSRPEVDYTPSPQEPMTPDPGPEREQPHEPDIEPGREEQ